MLVVGAAFAVLLVSVDDLRTAERLARHSEQVLVNANQLERLIVDLETGQRGFVITGQERFLEPWQAARTSFPEQTRTLQRLVADNPEQQARGQRIAQAATSYLEDYSVPLVGTMRRDPEAARTAAATEEGKRRVDAMRAEFDRFAATERGLADARQHHSDAVAHRSVAAAGGGLAGSLVLIVVFATYLSSAILQPVRRAAAMAGRLAGGDFRARLPEHGLGEIGLLQRSFNTMASRLDSSRAQLAASRTRIVAAGDQARRLIGRDLHDGTQQRLVSLALDLRSAEAAAPPELPELKARLAQVADGLRDALDDLREISRGIHPAILSEGGLSPALKGLARRCAVPVELAVHVPTRLPEPVEVAAYYVVSEALANVTKHAKAILAYVDVQERDSHLHLSVRDDGVGGAAVGGGSGLVGLTDRVEALGGTITVSSPPGQGTTLLVDLPTTDR